MKDEFKIGNLIIKHRTVPAPMAGLTDIAFRKLLDEIGGVGYMITEMISADGMIRRNERTFEMMKLHKFKTPQFIQLFGNNNNSLIDAVKIVENETDFKGIDFNMGCPAKKIVKKGAGSALLKDTKKVKGIVATIRKATKLPFTVKIRLGFEQINILETVKMVEGEGVDALAVHFRLRNTPYSIPADWGFVKKIKEISDITLIGNGDVFDYKKALDKLKTVDAVMIGRGAISNPLIFSETINKIDLSKKIPEIFLKLMDIIDKYYEDKLKMPKLKAYVKYIISGKPDSKALRLKLYKTQSIEEAKKVLITHTIKS